MTGQQLGVETETSWLWV